MVREEDTIRTQDTTNQEMVRQQDTIRTQDSTFQEMEEKKSTIENLQIWRKIYLDFFLF